MHASSASGRRSEVRLLVFLVAALLGAVAGAGAGMLLAPPTGRRVERLAEDAGDDGD